MELGLFLALMLLVILHCPAGAIGWGKEGHYIICKISEAYIKEEALVAVKKLLPESASGDLANVCSWADDIRFHYRWSSALHYIDTPDFACNYNYARDCHDEAGRANRCVAGAIYNYTNQLTSEYQTSILRSNYNLSEAIMFLAHFMGDIHQPLHVGFAGDLGGNTVIVRWYRRKTNLHHVWDTMIIEEALKRFHHLDIGNMIDSIKQNITGGWSEEFPLWERCNEHAIACPNEYASESVKLACKSAYKNATPGSILKDDYFLSRLPVVERRLAQGGVRLATLLNRIFSSTQFAKA